MKPEPVNKHVVCKACGLDWDRHGKEPTLEKCVELLKADLAASRRYPQLFSMSSGSGRNTPPSVWVQS